MVKFKPLGRLFESWQTNKMRCPHKSAHSLLFGCIMIRQSIATRMRCHFGHFSPDSSDRCRHLRFQISGPSFKACAAHDIQPFMEDHYGIHHCSPGLITDSGIMLQTGNFVPVSTIITWQKYHDKHQKKHKKSIWVSDVKRGHSFLPYTKESMYMYTSWTFCGTKWLILDWLV